MRLSPRASALSTMVALALALASAGAARGQDATYAVRGGLSVATQQWSSFEQSPLVGFHVDVQRETRLDEARGFTASLGLHQRGSAIRTRRFSFVDPRTMTPVSVRPQSIAFVFNNVTLALGLKQYVWLGGIRTHASVGLRGEYTVSTDLGEDLGQRNIDAGYGPSYPVDEFVNKLVYGLDVGAGMDFAISPALDGLFEVRLSPDLSRQYFQPPVAYFDPGAGATRTAAERRIHNLTVEVSVGVRFLRYAGEE